MNTERLRELLGKATPGPWAFDGPPDNHIVWSSPGNRVCFMAHSNGHYPERDTATATLIVEAVNALPALLDRIEALEAALQAFISWGGKQCPCENEEPNPCPLCDASVENLETCKAIEAKFPRDILTKARAALGEV